MKLVKFFLIALGFYILFITVRAVGVEKILQNLSGLHWKLLPLLIFYPIIFAFDTLDFNQIENFPFVQCWVNTACSRILDDYEKFPKPLVDISDINQPETIQVKFYPA